MVEKKLRSHFFAPLLSDWVRRPIDVRHAGSSLTIAFHDPAFPASIPDPLWNGFGEGWPP